MKYVLFILLMLGSAIAYADCNYNGESYPTGTEIAGFVCQEDGSWS